MKIFNYQFYNFQSIFKKPIKKLGIKDLIKKRRIQSFNLSIFQLLNGRGGQSLAEVMIGLAIGAILIGAASFAITTTLKTNLTTQRSQFAANAAQEMIERTRAYASADWQNIYGLTKGSSTQYYFIATGTQFFVAQGKEGLVENDIRNGLVGQWGFDEATGTVAYDATGNRNSGTLTNNPTRTTSTCKIGNCLNFDGVDDEVNIPHNSMYKTNSVSVGLWVNLQDQSKRHVLLTTWYGFTTEINSDKTFKWGLNGLSGQYFGTQKINWNEWTYLVGTFDDSLKKQCIYINGVQKECQTVTGSVSYQTNPLYFSGSWDRAKGLIDDARIYNRALSADEVKQLYNSAAYSRYFYVENGCRTNDASSTYSGVSPCTGGSVDDPSSQKVSSVVQWGTGGSSQIVLADILTRWKNAIFQQSDWSGGVSENVLINSGTTFSSSSNVNSGGGSLRINGL